MRRLALFIAFVLMGGMSASLDARGIEESVLREHIRVLASDEFEGRDPGTAGEEKTINYIAEEWGKAGLKPAASDGSWFEPVPMISYMPGERDVRFHRAGRKLRFSREDIVLVGREENYLAKKVPVLFAGSGLKGDGSLIDGVKGKALLLLLDTPENAQDELRSFRARSRALIEAGAEVIIYVANPDEWKMMKRRVERRSVRLEGQRPRAPLQGAVSTEFAVGLVTSGGRDWDKLRAKAKTEDFAGIDLGVTGDFNVASKISRIKSNNVIGKITGRKPGSGAVMYLGHWDHFGYCGEEGDDDGICNGAVDNASGIAVLIEVAAKLARKKHDRDIYFLATTAEERGLLGAYAYTRKPVFPLEDIVVALNIDTIAIAPKGAKVAIIGRGTERLDKAVEKVARKKRRRIEKSDDANAFIRRQDGWAFTQKGVPALMVGGAFSDLKLLQEFLRGVYHGVDDELTAETELGGATEDADLHVALGKYFASTRKFRRKKATAEKPSGE